MDISLPPIGSSLDGPPTGGGAGGFFLAIDIAISPDTVASGEPVTIVVDLLKSGYGEVGFADVSVVQECGMLYKLKSWDFKDFVDCSHPCSYKLNKSYIVPIYAGIGTFKVCVTAGTSSESYTEKSAQFVVN